MILRSILNWIKCILNSSYNHLLKKRFLFIGSNVYLGRFSELIGAKYIHIADGVSIGDGTSLCAWSSYFSQKFLPQIILDKNVVIGQYAHITAINKIYIGEGTLIGRWVTITDNSHGKTFGDEFILVSPIYRHLQSKGAVIIGKNVWIGDKATILPGVKIGNGAVIGANAVVTKDIPPYCLAVGNPIRIIDYKKNE